jgi:1-phosphofructokinase family hexose kinase
LLVATPNIAVDRTVRLPELRPGQVLRPSRAVVTAGGKGLNVGRALARLDQGRRATLVSFRAEVDGALLDRLFAVEPVDFVGVDVPGEARVATIYLEDSGRVTVLNEPGPQLSAADWARFEQAIADQLAGGQATKDRHRTLVCSGSLPPGAPDDAYATLVKLGHRAGVRVVVDAARITLVAALRAGPDIITPNLAEAEGALAGHAEEAVAEGGPDVPRRACAAVRALCERGARIAAVTAGAAGTAYGDAEEVFWLPTLPVRVVNPIGAGDSFVAGLVHALESGAEGVEAVVFASATATASVEQELAGGVDPARVREIAAELAGRACPERDLPATAETVV